MSDEPRTPAGDRIVVIRPSRMPRGILIPVALVILAGVGFAVRMGISDWRGLSQEARRGWDLVFASKAQDTEPKTIAKAPEAKPAEKKDEIKDKAKADSAVAAVPNDNPAWDEIRRAAEKAHAEQEEAKRIKEEADRKLAETPPPPPRFAPRVGRMDPAAIAEIRRQHEAMMREMEAFMFRGRDDFDQMVRQQMEAQRRFMDDFANNRNRNGQGFGNVPPGFVMPPGFNLPPGFEGFARPLPGMDRMNAPWPGQPQIQERSGEDVRDGVRRTWKTRVMIMGPNGFAAR